VTAGFTVDATPQEVWAVLTDFDNMARFVSNLETSQVVSRQGNGVRVHTKGKARFGPLQFPFESVRELTLKPFERIQSRQVNGTLKRFEGETQVIATPQGTRIAYRGDSTSNQSIPPIVGPSLIKSETEEQFHEMQTEILRRRMEVRRNK
jgi:carbon monoxide dehydrogenase subunit G